MISLIIFLLTITGQKTTVSLRATFCINGLYMLVLPPRTDPSLLQHPSPNPWTPSCRDKGSVSSKGTENEGGMGQSLPAFLGASLVWLWGGCNCSSQSLCCSWDLLAFPCNPVPRMRMVVVGGGWLVCPSASWEALEGQVIWRGEHFQNIRCLLFWVLSFGPYL